MADLDDLARDKRRVAQGAALYSRGDPFDAVFAIRSGSFKSVAASGPTSTKVVGLHLPAEVMGLDAISSQVYGYDVIALEDAEVCAIPYGRLTRLALHLPAVQHAFLRILSEDIARDRGLILRLAGMPAKRRLAAFLVGHSMRYRKLGYSATHLRLRMPRKDLASYLGLTVETLSRLFAVLQREHLIDVHRREVRLKDFAALSEFVGY
jgi:CRP/FNR family transcriptional regulator